MLLISVPKHSAGLGQFGSLLFVFFLPERLRHETLTTGSDLVSETLLFLFHQIVRRSVWRLDFIIIVVRKSKSQYKLSSTSTYLFFRFALCFKMKYKNGASWSN